MSYILEKYAPKSLNEHILKDAVQKLENWLKEGHKKPLLLYGPTGIGKSSLVRLFAKNHNFTLYELTPSDNRDKESILKEAMVVGKSQSIFASKNLLFFDDIDVFFSSERGGFEAIIKVAKEATNPVIFVATNIYANKKLAKLREICTLLQLKRPSYISIYYVLKKICELEGIKYEPNALKEIAKACEGDIRSALLDIDYLMPYGISPETIKLLGYRERKHDVFKTIFKLFKTNSFQEAQKINSSVDIDAEMMFAWVVENLPSFYDNKNLSLAFDFASKGDINLGRIYIRQNWTFLKYFIALGIIAPAIFPEKNKGFVKLSFPTFIKYMSKETSEFSKNRKAAEILQNIILGSKKKIIKDLELYKEIFSKPAVFKSLLGHITDEERKFLVDFFSLPKEFLKDETFFEVTDKKTEEEEQNEEGKQRSLNDFFS